MKNNQHNLRIVYMGTPEFAVAGLNALIKEGFNVVGVVTAPDKPAGRGMKMNESAVKKFAVENGLNILQPEKLRSEDFIASLKKLKPDVQIVVAFRMLPEMVWSLPPMGTINLHASLLPAYRGAAPINHAIINGEKFTGVTTFKLKHEIDTGNILLQKSVAIDANDDAGLLHDKLKLAGAELLVETIRLLADGLLKERPQDTMENVQISHAPKIFPSFCEINFNKKVGEINNFIRGLSPYPGAFTWLDGKKFKIFKIEMEEGKVDAPAGERKTDGKSFLKFAALNGYVHALEVQMEGKKRMLINDFLRGYRFQ